MSTEPIATFNSNEQSGQNSSIFDQLSKTMHATIDNVRSINEQVKTLAINARIEASQAGSSGSAFGVVAQEMLALSTKTARVAEELDIKTNDFNLIGEDVVGTRLADLALNNIDLIDRNLYERTCDVRWWATDASVVDALTKLTPQSASHASTRMKVILNAYTVYFDLVLCDTKGIIIANGRPDLYTVTGLNVAKSAWFSKAICKATGDEYGFQSAHVSPLVNHKLSLIYSCTVRREGKTNGAPIGVLGVIFNWETFSDAILNGKKYDNPELAETDRFIIDPNGTIIASSRQLPASYTFPVSLFSTLFAKRSGYIHDYLDGNRVCIAQAISPGFETYETGWHSIIVKPQPDVVAVM
ncbi:MAG: methyl-accepting chemotaxis protein [Planctomycetota bacterium]